MTGIDAENAVSREGCVLRLMEHLHETTGETISLSTQSDIYMQYVHVLVSEEPLQFRVKPGTRRSLVNSGLGWLLLSAKQDEEINTVLRRVNADDPGRRIALAQLMERVNEVRRQGYVYSRHTVTHGAGVIGMILPEHSCGPRFAIGIGGPVERLEEKHDTILHALRRGISRFLPV